jgi:hypothetical protein
MTTRALRSIRARAFALILSCCCFGMAYAADGPAGKADPGASEKSAAADKASADKATADKATADKAAAAKRAADKAAADKAAAADVAANKLPPKCPATGDLSKVRVVDAYRKAKDKVETNSDGSKKTTPGAKSRDVRLGDEIHVEINGLNVLWDHAECMTPPKKVLLFIEGRPITNVFPEPPTDPAQSVLIFPLRRDEKSREAWTAILGRPKLDPRPIDVSVGIDGMHPVLSDVRLNLEVISMPWLAFWLATVIAASWRVLAKRDMLRVPGTAPPTQRPYSLARVQMMWWFFLTLASYLFIGLITGDYSSTITGTVLVLTGISAGTTLLAGAIDQRPPENPAPAPTPPPVSVGIWQDIVSDALGPNIHRYQMAVWTVVLGIVFVWSVYQVLAMPQFSETLLALMGVSSGTYIGLKNNEPR